MNLRYLLGLSLLLVLLAACASPTLLPTPTPTLTPTATPTPTVTLTPSPTLTPTPIPPAELRVTPPADVSAVEPRYLGAALIPPPGVGVSATLFARVLAPDGALYRRLPLLGQGTYRYRSPVPLTLPLAPPTGTWSVAVEVSASLDVTGTRTVSFTPAPVPFRPLTETLPGGVTLDVPQAFREVLWQGSRRAGARAWRYAEGEVALWWAPGPTEPLQADLARAMLSATHAAVLEAEGDEVEVTAFEETTWDDRAAFHAVERWSGPGGGPAEVWVLQDAADWLYVLRVRAVGGEEIPALMEEVAATFRFVQE